MKKREGILINICLLPILLLSLAVVLSGCNSSSSMGIVERQNGEGAGEAMASDDETNEDGQTILGN